MGKKKTYEFKCYTCKKVSDNLITVRTDNRSKILLCEKCFMERHMGDKDELEEKSD